MSNLTIGYLPKADESKISTIPVTEGQIIYSENSGVQFVDYENTRHVYGNVITGVYSDNSYVDFTVLEVSSNILDYINTNGLVTDGQLVKCKNGIYRYRKINNTLYLTNVDKSHSHAHTGIAFVINTSNAQANIDALVSISSSTGDSSKLFFIKIINGAIDLASCKDLDGELDTENFPITVTNTDGLFEFATSYDATLQLISYSANVSNTESFCVSSSFNESDSE